MRSPILLLVLSLVALAAGCAALTPAPPPEQNAELRLDRGLAALEAGRYTRAFDDLAWVYTHCAGRAAGGHALVALAALELDPRNLAARPDVGTELLGRVIRDPGTPDWLRPMAETAFLTGLALGAPHPEGIPEPDPAMDTARMAELLEPADSLEPPPLEPADSLHRPDPLEPADSTEQPDSTEHADRAEQTDPADVPPATPEGQAPAEVTAPDPAPADMERAFGCGPHVPADDPDRVASSLPILPGPSMATTLARSEAAREFALGRVGALERELATVREQLQATEAELERIRRTLKP